MNKIAKTSGDVMRVESIEESLAVLKKDWARAVRATQKAYDQRIALGFRLLSLKQRIEAGEAGVGIAWWKWFEENVERSRRDAQRLMDVAAADDPQFAIETERAAARDGMRALKERRLANLAKNEVKEDQGDSEGAESADEPESEPEPEPERAPSRRALPKGLPSYVPAEALAAANAADTAADEEIARIVGEILRLPTRQQDRLITRLAQVCHPLGMRLRARGPI